MSAQVHFPTRLISSVACLSFLWWGGPASGVSEPPPAEKQALEPQGPEDDAPEGPSAGETRPADRPGKGWRGGRHRMRGPEGRPGAGLGPMSEEEQAELHAFVQEHFPLLHQELESLRTGRPAMYGRRVRQMAPALREMMHLTKEDPELGAIMVQERREEITLRWLARRYRGAEDEAARQRLENKIREHTGRMFDLRHQRRDLEIRRLSARLDELRSRHEENARHRDRLIKSEADRVLRGEWPGEDDAPPPPPPPGR